MNEWIDFCLAVESVVDPVRAVTATVLMAAAGGIVFLVRNRKWLMKGRKSKEESCREID